MSDSFVITPDHLTLLQRSYTSWDPCEFGAPEIDPKRPYGNSDVLDDIAEILPHLAGDEDAMHRIHRELETVLQIVLATQSFRPGAYERSTRWDALSWRLVAEYF